MITTTLPTPSASALGRPRAAAVRAELTKLRTLRATWLTMTIAVIAAVALSALNATSTARQWDTMTAAERGAFDPASTTLIGVLFGALVLGALGVRTISAEYANGMIRSSAIAVPRRTRILSAKVTVIAASTFMVAIAANVAGFVIGQQILHGEGIDAAISDRRSVVAIVAGAIAVSAFAAIGVGLGTIVRRAAIANVLMALVVIGGQLVGTALPATTQRFLPFNALQATVSVKRADELLAPGVALASIVGYALVVVAVAAVLLRRRDV